MVTDAPGLVEGAHEGRGMGIAFLRHIERASVILYLIDMSPASGRRPVEDLEVLEAELAGYKEALASRRKLAAANKMDLNPDAEALEALREECAGRGLELYEISAVTGKGVDTLVRAMAEQVERAREAGLMTGERVVFEQVAEDGAMSVVCEGGRFTVTGARIERLVRMTDWSNDDARTHLAHKLKDAGVDDMLAGAGAGAGDDVEIAGRTFEYAPDSAGVAGSGDRPARAGEGSGPGDG